MRLKYQLLKNNNRSSERLSFFILKINDNNTYHCKYAPCFCNHCHISHCIDGFHHTYNHHHKCNLDFYILDYYKPYYVLRINNISKLNQKLIMVKIVSLLIMQRRTITITYFTFYFIKLLR